MKTVSARPIHIEIFIDEVGAVAVYSLGQVGRFPLALSAYLQATNLVGERSVNENVKGIAAALLPYESDGRIAVDAFRTRLISTHQAGLMNAVNMDTGYVNYLTDGQKLDVLQWTREVLGEGTGCPSLGGSRNRA